MAIVPVVLNGGAGTRLWPLSRAAYPKQFLPMAGEMSTFQQTCRRLTDAVYRKPIVICNEDHRFITAEQMRDTGIEPDAIVLEPVARNTAPAALIGSLLAAREEPRQLVLLVPSDHLIFDQAAFTSAIERGRASAMAGKIVTFGIKPKEPHTGYGYIETVDTAAELMQVRRFVEKPDRETARSFLADDGFFWNAGIFLFDPFRMIELFQEHHPGMLADCRKALENAVHDLDFLRLESQAYENCAHISIDHAIMEKAHDMTCVTLDAGWRDIGSWQALGATMDEDGSGNATRGDIVLRDAKNCLGLSDGGAMLAILGLEDVLAVATRDVVLVAARDRADDVKSMVEQLSASERREAVSHARVYRPWGWYEGLSRGEKYQVKCLMVKPGAKLSLQIHRQRAEHWIVVSGSVRVSVDGREEHLRENQSTYIPIGAPHRLENPAADPALLIEVQSGSYLGEDDIIRLSDEYGRSAAE